ncbi:hemagglutinin repeat-containing protein [Pantoea sp. Acro-807]|uniref:two-partner secretion domain-containing protein n=1 Tax=Pantoea sp. Acro-807 TaxID=2608356 RepID=UPI001419E050|nr:hemagglutinin repeat-containing protein [Pantoea sp. Acro-807]NIE69475.1 filamentous hemagglutinin N-terminal domain-containing protein [Pantoea sp. Acro-807]
MNKNRYRVIFNTVRGMLMVVPDIAKSGRAGSARASGLSHTLSSLTGRVGALCFSLWLAMGVIQPASAAIVADAQAPGGQRPTIINSASGTPQINIQTPSAGGVSRNTYSQFDVGKRGAILNNSHKNVQTGLGGMVSGNPWLARGEAKVILNEVNSRNPSRLNGFVEVAGQKAQVVIANPSGITCNGCGFINASRGTLTTGQAQLNNGNLTGFNVERGEVVVEGAGMDSSRQDYTDIIARSVKVNASVWARDLRVTTGRNKVDAAHQQVTKQSDEPATEPRMALDVSSLGGMYAGKIRLVGTERGVGVRNAGNIGAQAGSVVITADGRIENSGAIQSRSDLQLAARQGVSNSGTIFSGGKASVTSAADVQNRGSVVARNDVTLQAGSLNSTASGVLAAGVQDDGRPGESGNLTLTTTGQLRAQGKNLAGGSLSARGQTIDLSGSRTEGKNLTLDAREGDIATRSGTLTAQQQLTARTGKMLNNDGATLTASKLNLQARDLSSQQGQILQTGRDDLTLSFAGSLNNQGGRIATNSDNLTLNAAAIDNQSGDITHTGRGTLSITTGNLRGSKGSLRSNGQLTLRGGDVDLDSGTTSARQIDINADSLANRQGFIASEGDLSLRGAQLANQQGVVRAGKTLRVTADALQNGQGRIVSSDTGHVDARLLDNRNGQLAAQQALTLRGDTLDNRDGGLIQSGAQLDIGAETLLNQNSGEKGGVISQGDMLIRAGQINNTQGLMLSGNALQLAAGGLNNVAGTLVAQEQLSLDTHSAFNNRAGLLQGGSVLIDSHGEAIDNQSGTLYSLSDLHLHSGAIDNQAGTVGAKGDLTLQSGEVDNRSGGRIVSEQAASLEMARLDNRGGEIQSIGDLLVSAQSMIDNAGGLIRSGANAVLNALQLNNQDTQGDQQGIEAASLRINSDDVFNQRGMLLADRQLTISSRGSVDNRQGTISAGEDLLLQSNDLTPESRLRSFRVAQPQSNSLTLENREGVLKAGRSLTIRADRLAGDGQILSLGDITLVSQQSLNNRGEMIANGNFNFTTAGDVDNSGKLLAGGKLDLRAPHLLNAATGEINAGQNWLTLSGQLTNYGLIDGKQTLLKASVLTNTGSGRLYGDSVGVQANIFNNLAENGTAATLAGRERVDIGVQTLNNRDHGLIYSAGDMALGGELNADGLATGRAGTLNNHSSTIESAGNMQMAAGEINNVNDRFSTGLVTVSSEAITGYQHSGDTVRWKAGEPGVFVDRNSADSLLNLNTPGNTGSNNDNFYQYDYTRTVQETQIAESDPAKIIAGGDLTINADRVLNDKSQIIAGNTLTINARDLNNVEVAGQRITTDVGKVTHYKRIRHKGGDEQGDSTSDYTPPDVIETIALKPGELVDHGELSGNPLSLVPQSTEGTDATTGRAGGVNAHITGSMPDIAALLKPGQHFDVPGSQGENASVIRIVGPDTRLPDNSLFRTNPSPGGKYLVETDPRFTQEKQWLSSDYMQDALTQNSDNVLKRLGDGYYEQRLIREQVMNLTGQRYLGGFTNDEDQYKALMNNAIAFSQRYHLTPGVALTPEQMGLLTKDIVWLVNAQVRLPDGSSQTVLVPQVYARIQPGDVDGSGALIAGRNLNLNLGGGLFNSGTLAGREVVKLSAGNITNMAGTIKGASVDLLARADINNIGGVIGATDSLLARAGRDINTVSTTRSVSSRNGENQFDRTTVDSVAGMYVQGDDGRLILQAGRDITLTAAQVVNSGENSQTVIKAGRDLTLNTVSTANRDTLVWDSDNSLKQGNTQEIGSEVVSKGDLSLLAGNDLHARAATLSADVALALTAGHDVTLTNGENIRDLDERQKTTGSGGWLSKSTTTTRDQISRQTAQGSSLNGDTISVAAGNDLRVQGSQIASTGDLSLQAGHDLSVTGATERNSEQHLAQEKKSGFSGTGGIGFSYGKQSLKTTDTAQETTSQGSTVGSVNGSVSLTAGNRLDINGSDLIAGKNLTLDGREVSITAAENQSSQTHRVEQKTSGLTLALSGTAGSALNTAAQTVQEAKSADSGRLAALQGTKAALSGVQAVQAGRLAEAQGDSPENNNAIGVSLSYGSQSSTSTQRSEQRTAQGSSLTAGDNLSVVARGSGVKGHGGDLTVQGSQLQAGRDLLLSANRDLNLLSAANTSSLEGKNESHGGTAGIGIGAGQGGWGISVSASANKAKGSEQGSGVTHTETQVSAGREVTLVSGHDTTLQGAQVSGEKIRADVARNLTLTSEQDSDRYDSKQQSASAGGSFTFGSMTGSANVNLSRDKMHSTWQSVEEQTGLFAGKGGFDVTAGGHTQLNGAVIGSTATADKNRLETGTLGWRDIENRADYKVEHQSAGVSTGGSIGGQFAGNMANGLLTGANHSGSGSSLTNAAVSGGALVIRDGDKQSQDVSGLSRDAAHANQTLSPIFDKEREQNRLQAAQLIGEIGNQAADIARTEGQIAGERAKRDPAALQAAKAALAGKGNLTPAAGEIAEQAYKTAAAPFGTGSALQQGIQAATAAVQGLAGGSLTQAVTGVAAPYLAEVIHNQTLNADGSVNVQANLMAHAVVGAVTAYAAGNSALSGASGAAMGEYIAQRMYPGTDRSDLTETQRQTISALGTLAAGLAGGVAGDSTAGAVAAAQAGRNAVEYNHLSPAQQKSRSEELTACGSDSSCKASVREHYAKEYDKVQAQINTCSTAAECVAVAKEMKQWQAESSARSDELAAKARNEGMDSLTPAEKQEWVNLRGAQSNFDGSINTLIYRAQMFGGSEETTTELVNIFGHAAIANAAGAATGISKATGGKYTPNADAVGNMGEFFKQSGFGSQMKESAQKTSQIFQGQSVYQAKGAVGDYIAKGDKYYLDGLHKDHIEVFDSKGKVKAVLNIDGSFNDAKTKAARAEGRRIPK